MKKYSAFTIQYHVQFQGTTEKNHAFASKCCISNEKRVIVTHFTMKIIRTYLYITCNNKILFVKMS